MQRTAHNSTLKSGAPLKRKKPLRTRASRQGTPAKRKGSGKKRKIARAAKKRQREIDNPQSAYWERKCKPLWGKACRIMWDFRCAISGQREPEPGAFDAHHLFSRSMRQMRYRPVNIVLLSPRHHMGSRECSAHNGTGGFWAVMRDKHPGIWHWYQDMRPFINKPEWLKDWDWKADYEALTAIIEKHETYEAVLKIAGLKKPQA